MKQKLLPLFVLSLALSSCDIPFINIQESNSETVSESISENTSESISEKINDPYNEYEYVEKTGELQEFNLLSPTDNEEVLTVPTFTWEEVSNASSYTLEVCSSTNFTQQDNTVYVKKSGIVSTSFTLSSVLKHKDTTYYWRVMAVNKTKKKLCNGEYKAFYLKANVDEEIEFKIEYADEWEVHKQGSKADVSIDNSNFFNNDKKSLMIKFNSEDTNQGIPESDGWMVITHQQETEMYGVDSFYFNFYYSGQSAKVFLRVVDEDNEYYNAEIKLANNVKQQVIMKFDEFTLRTKGGTTIANQVFDYNHIKYIEFVFEQSFGDGICMVSDLKAVSFEKYSDRFIDKVNFNDIKKEDIINDNYNFMQSYSEDGNEFTMSFSGSANELNNNGIYGYGFVKMNINKNLSTKDAFKLKIKYTGPSDGKILLRFIEEDGDRWVYRQASNTIPEDGIVVIPYNAFTLSEYKGDGVRQFYYLKQIQFGIEGVYSAGSITFSDVCFVNLEDEIDNLYVKTINENGIIDDFESYKTSASIYYKWQTSTSNKDEALDLNKDFAFGANNKCVKVAYKSDMGPAEYGVQFEKEIETSYNAFSFWALDYTSKINDARFNYLDTVGAKAIITLYVNSGEEYRYVIDKLNNYWTKYTISFDDFIYANGTTPSVLLESTNILGIKLGFQYYYYLENGTSSPLYTSNNPIYLDNIKFENATATSQAPLATKISCDKDNVNITTIETFEKYEDTEELLSSWGLNDALDYSNLELEENTTKYMEMQYKGNSSSVRYEMALVFDETVKGKAIKLDLYGDNKATVYINIYITYAGSNYKYRATLSNVSSGWYTYTIGFNNFELVEGTGSLTLSNSIVPYINKISFGIVNYSNSNLSYVSVDNIKLSYEAKYTTNTKEER